MKPTDKIRLSLGTLALLTFLFINPFNWSNDDGNPVTIAPWEWVLYGATASVLLRVSFVNFKVWRSEVSVQRPAPALHQYKDYSDEPQVWGFVLIHYRADDKVLFGPFKTVDELDAWYSEVGGKHGVSGVIVPLMNPHGDPQDFWWIPRDMPWTEVVKPKKNRTIVP